MSKFSAPGVVGDQNEGLRDSKGVISNSPENSNGNHKTKEGRLIGVSTPPQQMPGGRKILLHLQLQPAAKSEEDKDKEEGETTARHPGPVFETLAGLAEASRHSASLLFNILSWQHDVVVSLTGDCPSHHERCNLV